MSCNNTWCDRYTGEECGITWCPAHIPRNTSNTIDVNTIITGDTKNELVAVVRCKDCVFSNAEYTHCCLLDTCIIENDFCSWGERREIE